MIWLVCDIRESHWVSCLNFIWRLLLNTINVGKINTQMFTDVIDYHASCEVFNTNYVHHVFLINDEFYFYPLPIKSCIISCIHVWLDLTKSSPFLVKQRVSTVVLKFSQFWAVFVQVILIMKFCRYAHCIAFYQFF